METQLKQCHNCQEVFCSTCSTTNYDEREDRVFCLDCNLYRVSGSAACVLCSRAHAGMPGTWPCYLTLSIAPGTLDRIASSAKA
jgi:hypothetical protein